MSIADGVREIRECSMAGDKVDRLAFGCLGEVVMSASRGDSNVIVFPGDMAKEGEYVSTMDVREVMGIFRGMGFRVTQTPLKGAFNVSWGDAVDEGWCAAL